MSLQRCVFYLIIVLSYLCNAQEQAVTIDLMNGDFLYELSSFPDKMHDATCSMTADIALSVYEYAFFTDTCKARIVYKADIVALLRLLQQKNKFTSAMIVLSPEAGGMHIAIHAYAAWTFSRLKIQGSLIGKNRYRQWYMLQHGDQFDESKHQYSCERIQEQLHNEGYLNASVADTFAYEHDRKALDVALQLDEGPCFHLNDIAVVVQSEKADKKEIKRLQKQLQHRLWVIAHAEVANDATIKQCKQEIGDVCARYGYFDMTTSHAYCLQQKHARVDALFTVQIGEKKQFTFFGNHFFSYDYLLHNVVLIGKHTMLIPPPLIAEDIEALYKQYGFLDIDISWRETESGYYFCITEGERARIKHVLIHDAHYFQQSQLEKHFIKLKKHGLYDESLCKAGIEQVLHQYFTAGFWGCTIDAPVFVKRHDGRYDIEIIVHEVEQRILQQLDIQGSEHIKRVVAPQFARRFRYVPGSPFSLYLVSQQRAFLSRILQETGHIYVTPRPQFEQGDAGINLSWYCSGMDEQVLFGKTVVSGSPKTPFSVIHRELAYAAGAPWSSARLMRSQERLRSLGIFDAVAVYPAHMAQPEKTKTIVVKVHEDEPYEVRAKGGVQFVGRNFQVAGASFRAGGSFVWKNPREKGDRLLCDGVANRFRREFIAQYEVPGWQDMPIRTAGKVYHVLFDQPVLTGQDRILYQAEQAGALLHAHYDWWHTYIGNNLGIESLKIDGVSAPLAKKLQFTPELVGVHIPYLFFEPTLFAEYVDNKMYPTHGWTGVLSAKAMFPLSQSDAIFIKVLAEQALYVPLRSSVVCAVRFRVGHIFRKSFTHIVPPERFYLGGSHSVRSYQPDHVPPVTRLIDGANCLVPVGGKTMLNVNLEFRVPLYYDIDSVFFGDMGVLSQGGFGAIQPHDIVGGIGFGLRYQTPIGPIRFDIGWKLKDFDLFRNHAWFLTLGHAF